MQSTKLYESQSSIICECRYKSSKYPLSYQWGRYIVFRHSCNGMKKLTSFLPAFSEFLHNFRKQHSVANRKTKVHRLTKSGANANQPRKQTLRSVLHAFAHSVHFWCCFWKQKISYIPKSLFRSLSKSVINANWGRPKWQSFEKLRDDTFGYNNTFRKNASLHR